MTNVAQFTGCDNDDDEDKDDEDKDDEDRDDEDSEDEDRDDEDRDDEDSDDEDTDEEDSEDEDSGDEERDDEDKDDEECEDEDKDDEDCEDEDKDDFGTIALRESFPEFAGLTWSAMFACLVVSDGVLNAFSDRKTPQDTPTKLPTIPSHPTPANPIPIHRSRYSTSLNASAAAVCFHVCA